MIVGTCSICRGPVEVPEYWMGSIRPQERCSRCGATGAPNYGPVIPMTPDQSPVGPHGHGWKPVI